MHILNALHMELSNEAKNYDVFWETMFFEIGYLAVVASTFHKEQNGIPFDWN